MPNLKIFLNNALIFNAKQALASNVKACIRINDKFALK